MKMLADQQIDAYMADTRFRQRDPRFNDVEKYKERTHKERIKKSGAARRLTTKDFKFADDLSYCICPAGKRLYRNGADTYSKGLHAGTVKPVFAHIRYALRLDRFNYRGKRKVNTQWKLFSIVHNLLKVHRLAFGLDTG